MKKALVVILSMALLFTLGLPVFAADSETVIVLSDSGVTVDGEAASTSSSSKVYTGADIIYYEAGKSGGYGEGTTADEHSASDAAAHKVVTITQPGVYRISGTLSKGQLAIDLGDDAKEDPNAVVTLILDGVNITCTVAPAVIFYNVYECGVVDATSATGTVDTSAAGANVIIADNSKNYIDGSYVARIYQEGTTKKLHKYDGAFYSKMSMNVSAEAKGTGELHINAANEGLDSELHLTINGGNIWIEAQNDGINTNEDNVSVTTINDGYLFISAGLGVEGDGIDSNGFLTINGGTIISYAQSSADGGIDADRDILLNGGTVIALGGRNDAVSASSKQPYAEFSYASTKTAGTLIRIADADGNEILTFNPTRPYQSFTYTSPALSLGTTYHVYSGGTVTGVEATDGLYAKGGVYSGGIQQQYTGNQSGGFGGMGGGMGRGMEGQMPEGTELPEGFDPTEGTQRPERTEGVANGNRPEWTESTERPENFQSGQGGMPFRDNMGQANSSATGEGSEDFVITAQTHSFSGVSDWTDATGKTTVTFNVNSGSGILSVKPGETPVLTSVTAKTKTGSEVTIPTSDIQLTITDVPSENYAESCMLSDGTSAMAEILPADEGLYQLTVSVVSGNETYTGTGQFLFIIGDFPFVDIQENNRYYDAIKFTYDSGLMSGTGNNLFSPSESVTRAMTITVLGRLAKAETIETEDFNDIVQGSWYSTYVGWAAKNSIVNGYGDGRYGPSDAVTRQQICEILYNYAKAYDITFDTGALDYSDAAQIADWASDAVAACSANGLLDGIVTGNTLSPTAALTRAELADIMTRFVELI